MKTTNDFDASAQGKEKEMVMNDRQITIREVADEVDRLVGSCHAFFRVF